MIGLGLGVNKLKFKGSGEAAVNPFATAILAFSLRDLGLGATNAIRVRRTGGATPTERDFTFTEIIDGTLTTWVGVGNDGFLTTWYEQSSGFDVSQAVSTKQPKIVNSGSLILENGKPTILFDGIDDVLSANLSYTEVDDYSFYMVAKLNSVFDFSNIFSYQNLLRIVTATAIPYKDISIAKNTNIYEHFTSADITSLNQFLLQINQVSSSYNLFTNNIQKTSIEGTLNYASPSGLSIGGRIDNLQYLDGNIQEIIILDNINNAISDNINNFYSIY